MKIDPQVQKHWEAVLRNENLDMSRGRTPQDDYAESEYCSNLGGLIEIGIAQPTEQEEREFSIVINDGGTGKKTPRRPSMDRE
jgi:hypothetical protein